MSSILVVGVFGTDGKLSTTAQTIFTSKFQDNKFLKNNSWVGTDRSVELSLLNVDDVFETSFTLRNTIEKIVFVGVAQKEKKPTENSSVFELSSQYSQQAVADRHEFVTLNQSIRNQVTTLVESIKKDKKDEKFVIYFDDFNGHSQAVAEGAALATWKFDLDFDKFLAPIFGRDGLLLNSFKALPSATENDQKQFKTGIITGSSQLFSRYILELPGKFNLISSIINRIHLLSIIYYF